jgi:hypothetical protein
VSIPAVGTRVRAVRFWTDPEGDEIDDNEAIPPGTEGTVTGGNEIDNEFRQVWVDWDNGARLAYLECDHVEVLEPSQNEGAAT